MRSILISEYPPICKCKTFGREKQTVVSDLDGTLLRGRSSFPYFALAAFEVGGVLRLLFLLLASPIAGILYYFISESAAIRVLIFITFAGMKVSDIESAERAVLPKFYSSDLHPDTWRVFSACGKRCVLTANPTVMVEPFLKEFLGVDLVMGTEIDSWKGRATGLVKNPGMLVGSNKADALLKAFKVAPLPELALGDRKTDYPYMKLCKEFPFARYRAAKSLDPTTMTAYSDLIPTKLAAAIWNCLTKYKTLNNFPQIETCDLLILDRSIDQEGYIVPPATEKVQAVAPDELPKRVLFHDGRLVHQLTPLTTLITILWIPVGSLLLCLRMAAGIFLPIRVVYYAYWALGVRVTIKGTPPPAAKKSTGQTGVLFICSHHTLLDSIFLSAALGRPIPAVTYSLSRFSKIISPIKTVRLTRDQTTDANMIKKLLQEGDLVICPKGTTCREPVLLRFSALFAELTNELVPVAMSNKMSMFHGTTVRGWKAMDPFYFFMNPSPAYEVTFLNKLAYESTCANGKLSHDVANNIQQMIASILSYECTNFTRKNKYKMMA